MDTVCVVKLDYAVITLPQFNARQVEKIKHSVAKSRIGLNIVINQHHLRRIHAQTCQQLLRGQCLRSNTI